MSLDVPRWCCCEQFGETRCASIFKGKIRRKAARYLTGCMDPRSRTIVIRGTDATQTVDSVRSGEYSSHLDTCCLCTIWVIVAGDDYNYPQ